MKLILAIIQDQFVNKASRSLMENKIRVTKLSSSGGFLNSGNTTLLIGAQEEDIDKIVGIIEKECKSTKVSSRGQEVTVGGANLFIINMDRHLRI